VSLRERVRGACALPPLSEISREQRAELERELDAAEWFEDLRGKWQAAVLAAEQAVSEGPSEPHCPACGPH
jgi:vacuolar-type H+-ATPase subunit C/Vma6